MSAVKDIFKDRTIHLEQRRGTREQARQYCMKADTAFPGENPTEYGEWTGKQGTRTDLNDARAKIEQHKSWSNVLRDPEITSAVARHKNWAREIYESRDRNYKPPEIQLYAWEKEASELLEGKPEKRRVIWIWSAESGTGKSTFFDYCSARFNVLPGEDYPNTLYAYDDHAIIWFDLTRADSNAPPYKALEKFSNGGYHISSKYVSCRKLVDAHVVVTANFPPDESQLPSRCYLIKAQVDQPGSPEMDDSVGSLEL